MKRYTGIAFDRFAQGHGAEAGLLDELQPVPAPQGLGSQTRTAACDSERLRGVHVPLTCEREQHPQNQRPRSPPGRRGCRGLRRLRGILAHAGSTREGEKCH